MKSDVGPHRGEMAWLVGHSFPKKATLARRAGLVLLPAVAIAGLAVWTMLPGPSVAESQSQSQSQSAASPAVLSSPQPSWFDPAITPTQAMLATPADVAAPEEIGPPPAPVDGLKISSQSWRRGGLGSNAQVTFTLRNGNPYAVKDIEISCAFTRRDGSHLTDRSRLIHDTVNTKSHKTFVRMHVGFVNVNADKAKCALVTAQPLPAPDTSRQAVTKQ
jgi:hypothetical protein